MEQYEDDATTEGRYDYDAAVGTVKIEDITRDEGNRNILRRLKENDPNFDELWVSMSRGSSHAVFWPQDSHESGWVGYFIGKNTILKEMTFYHSNPLQYLSSSAVETFFRGVNNNESIQKISLNYMDLSDGEIFLSLRSFFENNDNLSELRVAHCGFKAGCIGQFSSVLKCCHKSLKVISIDSNRMGDEPLVDIIEALSAHPQPEQLKLWSMNIGSNECTALANVLNSTMAALQELNLYNNNIDDEGVDALVGAVANSRLQSLNLSSNRNVTARGCQSLAALLENPNSNLDTLYVENNNIGDEGVRIFAISLVRNHKLTTLDLNGNGITPEGYSSFSKVLCDTSSINNTFLSNHTLKYLGDPSRMPADVSALLILNKGTENNKKEVAMKKILKHHQHFDMQPFFEWDLKVLPIAINWFERAHFVYNNNEARIDKQKLDTIYQFIHAMPEVFEPVPGGR